MGNSCLQSVGLLFNRIAERRSDAALFSGNAADCHNGLFRSIYNVFNLRAGYGRLMEQTRYAAAFMNLLLHNVLGIAMAFGGLTLGRFVIKG